MHAAFVTSRVTSLCDEPKECLCEPDASHLVNRVNFDPSLGKQALAFVASVFLVYATGPRLPKKATDFKFKTVN